MSVGRKWLSKIVGLQKKKKKWPCTWSENEKGEIEGKRLLEGDLRERPFELLS